MTANAVTVVCRAKINLTLSVGAKRADGYHEIKTIMQPLTLCDRIFVRKDTGIAVKCEGVSGDNICEKAAKVFSQFGGAEIKIEKHIPLSAGLGGGSSDAAGTLIALNKLYGDPFSPKELIKLARSLGSDVPFFLGSGAALIEGTGEKITPVRAVKRFVVGFSAGKKPSTGDMYNRLDAISCRKSDETSLFLSSESPEKYLFNDFESVFDCALRKDELIKLGADGACLSGSGPTVFGLFSEKSAAEYCLSAISSAHPDAFLCETGGFPAIEIGESE